jgi:hemerythrin
MAYDWTPDLSVGIEEIDAQHRELLRRIGDLHTCMRAGETTSVPGVIAALRKYARTHFDSEERHMLELHYPAIERHRAEHASFTAELESFEKDLSQRGPSPSLAIHLAGWLSSWFRDHIRGFDRQLAAFVQAAGAVPP